MSATNPMKLESYKSWVLFTLAPGKNGRQKKPPIHPVTRKNLSWSNPLNWLTHAEACRYHSQGIGNGIAFVFSERDPFVFTDLDDCFDAQGNLLPYARYIVDTIDSYTERSVSGTGLHIVAVGKKTTNRCKFLCQGNEIEVYDKNHPMAYTGNVFENRSVINERQHQLDTLLASCRPDSSSKSQGTKTTNKNPAEDRSLLAFTLITALYKAGLSERRILAQLKKTPWWNHYDNNEHAIGDIRRIIRDHNHVLPRNPNQQADWNPAAISLSQQITEKRTAFSSRYYNIFTSSYDYLLSLYEHLITAKESAAVAVPCGKGKTTSMIVATAAHASPSRRFLLVQSTIRDIKRVADKLRALGCNAIEWHSFNKGSCPHAGSYSQFHKQGGKRLCAGCKGCTAQYRETGKDRFDDKQHDVLVCSKEHYKLAFLGDKLGSFNYVFHDEEPSLFSYYELDRMRLFQLEHIFENNQLLSDAFRTEYQALRDSFCKLQHTVDPAGNITWYPISGGHADKVTNPFANTLTYRNVVSQSLWARFHKGAIIERDLTNTLEFFKFFDGGDIWCMATTGKEVSPKNITLHFMRGSSILTTNTPTAILNASTCCSPIVWKGFTTYSIPAIKPSYSNAKIIGRLEQPTQSAMSSTKHNDFDKLVLSHCNNKPIGWIENADLDMKRIGHNVKALKSKLNVQASLSVGRARGSNDLKDCNHVVMDSSLFTKMPIYVLTAAIVAQKRIDADRIWQHGMLFKNQRFTQQGFSDPDIQSIYCLQLADSIYQLAMRGTIRSDEKAPYVFFTRLPNTDVSYLLSKVLMPDITIEHDLTALEQDIIAGKTIAEIARSANALSDIRSHKNRMKKAMELLRRFYGEHQ